MRVCHAGSLPAALSGLASLRSLNLGANQLTGGIAGARSRDSSEHLGIDICKRPGECLKDECAMLSRKAA